MSIRKNQTTPARGTNPVVKSGKTSAASRVTEATVQSLERAGSSESAKIARDYVRES